MMTARTNQQDIYQFILFAAGKPNWADYVRHHNNNIAKQSHVTQASQHGHYTPH